MPFRRGGGADERAIPRHELQLEVLPGTYAVCRLPAGAATDWAGGVLRCVIKSQRESQPTTVICDDSTVPPEGVEADRGWRAIRFDGVFDFGQVGVLASVLVPLARDEVPAMSVSTFETDYVLVKAGRFDRVRRTLEEAGHRVQMPTPGGTA